MVLFFLSISPLANLFYYRNIFLLELSKNLKCPLIASNFSRLIIDPNRSTEDPTLIMQLYDRNLIPENMNLTTQQIEFRKTDFYYPYHKKISDEVFYIFILVIQFLKQQKLVEHI